MSTSIPEPSHAPLAVGMLVYPGLTLLDLAGPQAVPGMHAETHLAWKTCDPVTSDSGVSRIPSHSFEHMPRDLDVLFVPGGHTATEVMTDDAVLEFLAEAGTSARYVTSVCSGALILGMAGLLDGHRAATHWAVYDVLEVMGVEADRSRVVIDRNRMTGGGVTAAIDFGLALLAELRGEEAAKLTQLMIEYDPRPPFDAGHPDKAGPEMVATVHRGMGDGAPLRAAIEAARRKRGAPA